MNTEIKNLLYQATNEQAISVTPTSTGGDSKSYFVKTNSHDYVVRIGGMRSNYDVEHALLKLINDRGALVPTLVSAAPNYSIQLQLPGQSIERISRDQWPPLLLELKAQLNIIHSIELPGFGLIDPEEYRKTGVLKGPYSNLFDFTSDILKKFNDQIVEKVRSESQSSFVNSGLSVVDQKKLLEVVDREPEIESRILVHKKSNPNLAHRLLHGDLHFEHILVDGGHLSGLIDFNKTLIGDPLLDIAYFSIMTKGELYKSLMAESDPFWDTERFHLYRLLFAYSKIHTRLVRHNYLSQQSKILDIALDELNI